MKYSAIEFGIGDTDILAFVGLCLPKTCDDKFIVKNMNAALKLLKTNFSVYSINSETQNYSFAMNWVSYLTILVLSTIMVLIFVATVRGR